MKLGTHDPLPTTGAESVRDGRIDLKMDAVIVGSGAGGAVMAYELAAKGRRVAVIEAGSYIPSSRFNERLADMFATLYQDKGAQTNDSGDLLLLQGRCLGGSTVVNGAVCFRIPDFVLEDWRRDHGLEELTKERLARTYEVIEGRLSVHVNAPHEINENSRILERGCQKLGWSFKPLSRNVRFCALTGFCLEGCASDRKQSMLVTYLPWAVEQGAQLIVDTTVERVILEGGRAVGVEGVMHDPATGAKLADVRVRAPVVVLAAGAVQTPLLLMKNGIAGSSGQVGRNLAVHPSSVVMAMFDEEVYGYRGATLGSYCDEFEHPDKGGFVLEGGTSGADAIGMIAPGYGEQAVRFMTRFKNIASVASLIHDENSGWIEWTGTQKKIHYTLDPRDRSRVRGAMEAAAKIFFAAGAREVYLPTYAPTVIDRPERVEAVAGSVDLSRRSTFAYSYHPQGTCRMGVDPKKSVVGPTGETHDVKGLYVADASVFPTSILVNPQMTVYAMSTLISEHINATA